MSRSPRSRRLRHASSRSDRSATLCLGDHHDPDARVDSRQGEWLHGVARGRASRRGTATMSKARRRRRNGRASRGGVCVPLARVALHRHRREARSALRLGQAPVAGRPRDPDRAAQPPAGEEPLRHRPRAARQAGRLRPPALPDRTNARRDVQRPRRPADGQPRQPLRPQRPARGDRARAGGAGCSSRTRGSSAASCSRATSSSPRRHSTCSPARGSSSRCTTGSATARTRRRTRGSSRSRPTIPWPEHPMPIERTRQDPSADPDGPPTFVTDDTHWWDGSQIYGRDPAFAEAIRSGEHGKLRLDERGLIPPRHRGARRPLRRRRELLGRSRAAALALHARAQRDLRPPARGASGASGTTSSSTRRGSSSRR